MADKKTQERLTSRRMQKIDNLRTWLKETVKVAEDELKKIDEHGLSCNFSCNHDILKWAERAHRTSYELWFLKDTQEFIERNHVTSVDVEWEDDS